MTNAAEPTPLQRAWPVGASVVWLHTLPGGYRLVRPVPATVLCTNSYAGTVKIAAQSRGGKLVERWVRPERLRREGAGRDGTRGRSLTSFANIPAQPLTFGRECPIVQVWSDDAPAGTGRDR